MDATTGDLAVANIDSKYSGSGSIAIFKNASGAPTFYSDARITRYFSCSFDGSGNLFLDGDSSSQSFIFAELPRGSTAFQLFSLNQPVTSPGSVEWDGRYVAVGVDGAHTIYRVQVSGSKAEVVSTTRLDGKTVHSFTFWIQGKTTPDRWWASSGKCWALGLSQGRQAYYALQGFA